MKAYLRFPFRRRARNLSGRKWLQRCRIGDHRFQPLDAWRHGHRTKLHVSSCLLMLRLPSIALVAINICPKLNVVRYKACCTTEEVNGIGSHPLPERESSVPHPTGPYTVVVPPRRDSIEAASDVRIRIFNAEIRGG